MTRRVHVIIDDDVYDIIQDHRSRKSISVTVNDMIRRIGSTDEFHAIVARSEDLSERILSYIRAEFDTKLEARRASFLAELRNEPR